MEKSRPGHNASPLIIERPDLTPPVRRMLAFVLTSAAWLVWLLMWLPVFAAMARQPGFDLPSWPFATAVSLRALASLAQLLPWVAAFAGAAVLLRYLREKLTERDGGAKKRWRHIGLERLASEQALRPERLAEWQSARVLYVSHDPLGNVTDAGVEPPRPFVRRGNPE